MSAPLIQSKIVSLGAEAGRAGASCGQVARCPPLQRTPCSMSQKRIYFFSPEESDGDQSLRNLLGGKGANLAEMYAARKAGDSTPPQHTCGLRAERRRARAAASHSRQLCSACQTHSHSAYPPAPRRAPSVPSPAATRVRARVATHSSAMSTRAVGTRAAPLRAG